MRKKTSPKRRDKTREQFNLALSMKEPGERDALLLLRAMQRITGLSNAGVIRLVVANNLEREFEATKARSGGQLKQPA
jgi:hypothetical protein